MFRAFFAIVVLLTLLFACSCQKSSPPAQKTSPDEMIAVLQKDGLSVEKGTSIMPFNAELAFHLTIDGSDCIVSRFASTELARDKSQVVTNGVAAGYWSFECASKDLVVTEKIRHAFGIPQDGGRDL